MSDDLLRGISRNIPSVNDAAESNEQKVAPREQPIGNAVGGFAADDNVEKSSATENIFAEQITSAGSESPVSRFSSALQELQGQSKLSNSEIQNLTSQFNQAESLRTEVRGTLQQLDGQNKLGNFKVQDLMSQFNQSAATFQTSLKTLRTDSNLSDSEINNLTSSSNQVEELRNRFNETMNDLQSQDKLGNFEIQDLMSAFNEAETLLSSVLKKLDDQGLSTIGKI